VDALLLPLLETIDHGYSYLNATDVSLVMLVRMMRRVPLVRRHMSRNINSYVRITEYWRYRRENIPIQGTTLSKNKSVQAAHTKVAATSLLPCVPREVMQRAWTWFNLLLASEKNDLPLQYDSDDEPQSVVGRKISVSWPVPAENKLALFKGWVSAYDENTLMHHVVYDDGTEKDHSLFTTYFTLDAPPP